MPIGIIDSLLIIFVVALVTFFTRVFPFLLFPKRKTVPKIVLYLGTVLTPAIIGMLVVYCLKSTTIFLYPYGIPEAIAVLTVILLHIWRRNMFLSIGVGTVLYMYLIQIIFI